MSSYRPKSLDELNNMYDKALSAQRAIKKGTSKINESNSSGSFFDDVIKEAELTLEREPQKHIADLSGAVDDFIKHFSETEKKSEQSAPVQKPQPKIKEPEAPKIRTEKKIEKKAEPIVATPSPAIARKQSGEHISTLMSDYVKIMNDQDDSDDDEPRQRKSFLSRKKEKKLSSKEAFREETAEEISEDPVYTPLSDELREEVFPFDSSASFDELTEEEEKPVSASEEAFNAFALMNKTKESFHNEVAEEAAEEDTEEEAEEEFEEETAEESSDDESAEEEYTEDEEAVEEASEEEDKYDDFSSHSEDEEAEEEYEEEFEEEEKAYSKGKNALRVTARIFLSLICVVTLLCSLFCASLSAVFNVNTGKEVFGKYYFFTSSHDFAASGVKAGELVICEKQSTVSDDETAVYIDLENRTFSFGVKDGSITSDDGDIIYLIGDNEVKRDDVLGTVHKTVAELGDVITLVYKFYVPVIAVLVTTTAVLLLIIIFALKKRRYDEYDTDEEDEAETEDEDSEISEETEDDVEEDIFADLD